MSRATSREQSNGRQSPFIIRHSVFCILYSVFRLLSSDFSLLTPPPRPRDPTPVMPSEACPELARRSLGGPVEGPRRLFQKRPSRILNSLFNAPNNREFINKRNEERCIRLSHLICPVGRNSWSKYRHMHCLVDTEPIRHVLDEFDEGHRVIVQTPLWAGSAHA